MVEILEKAGAKHCYGIVGDTLNHFTDSIANSSIEWVHVRHEEAGAFAAGAEALMSGHLTVCAGSCGPGSLHFINGLFEAHRNGAPVVLIASQLENSQPHVVNLPQYVDFKKIYQDCSVFCEEVHNASQVRLVMTLACQAAINQRGVAVVIMPANISEMQLDDELMFRPHFSKPLLMANPQELEQARDLLAEQRKITIFAGIGCQQAREQMLALAEKLQAPIVFTSRAKDFIDYDNPYAMGMNGLFGHKSARYAIENCDLLLLLGVDFAWAQYYPDTAKKIQIDAKVMHLGRRYPIDLGIVGHMLPTLQALLPLVSNNPDQMFLQDCLKQRDQTLQDRAQEERIGKDGVIHPQYLMALMSQYADDDAFFTADTGSPMVWVLRHIDVNGKRRTLPSLLHASMANAMPQALGIKKAYPERQVIAICGDGGLAMLMGDLLTIVQENITIKIVVINNRSLNYVEIEQEAEGLLDHYTELKNPDFGKLAEVIGFKGFTQKTGDGLEQTVQEFLQHDGPALLDVHTSMELVMPPEAEAEQVKGFSMYAAKALLSGRFDEVTKKLKDTYIN